MYIPVRHRGMPDSLLVQRTFQDIWSILDGRIRWMEVRDCLKDKVDNGKKQVREIEFEGERFDVMSVRRWRDRALRGT